MQDGIKPLDPRNQADIENAAHLHRTSLPGSPVSRLGMDFMRRFYYRNLVEDGLVCCDLYFVHGAPAGFIAYTKYSSDFMTRGLRHHWLVLAVAIAGAVLRQPARLGAILIVLGLMRQRRSGQGPAGQAELLSLGVLPEYRSSKFLHRTGRRISVELLESAKAYFRAEKVTRFGGIVESHNLETLLFYHALGCQVETGPHGKGKLMQVTCVVEERPRGETK